MLYIPTIIYDNKFVTDFRKKAHENDVVSIQMLKMSSDSVTESFLTIFKTGLNCLMFPDDWIKRNMLPIFKKGNKQNIKNYRPVSLLLICSKVLEYDNMLKYFSKNII